MNQIWKLKIWSDARGQDLVEYALISGFIVSIAAAASPALSGSISTVFSSVADALAGAGQSGVPLSGS